MKVPVKKLRVQMYMPEELVQAVDDLAAENGVNRSNLICQWCAQQVNARKLVTVMDEVIEACRRITPNNENNPELVKQLSMLMGVSELYKNGVNEGEN